MYGLFYKSRIIVTLYRTVGLNLEGGANQSEERGVEGDHAVAVQGHVHGHQTLEETETTDGHINQPRWSGRRPVKGGFYLAGHSVRTELSKAQRRLDPPEQGHDVQVFNTTPEGR